MAHQNWVVRPAAASCPAPMTRAALLALRTSGLLDVNCVYTVTDHVQGRLVAGTQIVLQAVSPTELSEQVEVNTTYDNEGWSGLYDIDLALVTRLNDNLGNHAESANGAAAANFDWGNTSWRNVTNVESTIIATYGAPAILSNVLVANLSTLNTTGFTGTITNSEITDGSTFLANGSNGAWNRMELDNVSTLDLTGYTAGGSHFDTKMNATSVSFVGQTGAVQLRRNDLKNTFVSSTGAGTYNLNGNIITGGSLTRTAGSGTSSISGSLMRNGTVNQSGTGTLSMSGNNVFDSTITQSGAGGIQLLTNNFSCSSQVIGNSAASITVTTTELHQSSILTDTGSTSSVTVSQCSLKSGSTIAKNGATSTGPLIVTYTNLQSTSRIDQFGAGTLAVDRSSLAGESYIRKTAASTAGNLTAQSGTSLDSQGFIEVSGTGNTTVTACTVTELSRINVLSGDRSYTITRTTLNEVGQLNLSGTGAGVLDTVTDTRVMTGGAINMSATGAATNRINYSTVSGSFGGINISGATTGQQVERVVTQNGSFVILGCTAPMAHSYCTALSGSTIRLNGLSVSKPLEYIHAEQSSTFDVSTATVAGALRYIRVTDFGDVRVNGVAGTVTRAVAQQGGLIVFNGGAAHASITKANPGTLTTGNFSHTNVIATRPISVTLTAPNTSRGNDLFNSNLV
jgi:hypothetical protein